jgi:hypothetical protein
VYFDRFAEPSRVNFPHWFAAAIAVDG